MASTDISVIVKAKDEASKEIKKVQTNLSKLGDIAMTAGKAVATFGAAGIAAAGAFALSSLKDFSDVGDAVEKMAGRTGLAAESVSALRVAADMGGTSIESVEAAVKKMQLTMTDANSTSDSMKTAFKGIGMTIDDIFVNGTTPDIQFELLANAIGSVTDPAMKTQLAVEAFGKAGTDLIPMFESGNFSMEAWSEQAKKLGVSFDDISAKKAAALNDAVGAMTTAWNGLKLKLGGELAPVITSFIMDSLIPLAEKAVAAVPTIDDMRKAIGNLRDGFKSAMQAFEEKTGLISQVQEGFAKIWNTLETELGPSLKHLWEALQPLMPVLKAIGEVVGLVIVVALKLMIAALIELIDLTAQWISKIADLVSWILEHLKPAFASMQQGFSDLASGIGWVISKFEDMKAAAVSALSAARSAIAAIPGVGAISSAISGRASGGPVSMGMPYIVGEHGRELFVPGESGTIMSNVPSSSGGGGVAGLTINIGTFVGGNPENAAREIGDLIIKRLQLNARV